MTQREYARRLLATPHGVAGQNSNSTLPVDVAMNGLPLPKRDTPVFERTQCGLYCAACYEAWHHATHRDQ
jgi:hypothetical protein